MVDKATDRQIEYLRDLMTQCYTKSEVEQYIASARREMTKQEASDAIQKLLDAGCKPKRRASTNRNTRPSHRKQFDEAAFVEKRMAEHQRDPRYAQLTEAQRQKLLEMVKQTARNVARRATEDTRRTSRREQFEDYADFYGEGAAVRKYGMGW